MAVATSQPSSPYEHASSSSNNNQATGAAITTSGNACTAENGAESIKRGDPFTTIWADYLAKQRALFRDFVKMFCVDPRESPDHPDDHVCIALPLSSTLSTIVSSSQSLLRCVASGELPPEEKEVGL